MAHVDAEVFPGAFEQRRYSRLGHAQTLRFFDRCEALLLKRGSRNRINSSARNAVARASATRSASSIYAFRQHRPGIRMPPRCMRPDTLRAEPLVGRAPGLSTAMKMNWLATMCVCLVAPATAAIEQANVTGGTVRGIVDNGVAAFKGVPFAAPPVGDLRWQAPRPVIPWSGVKQTSAFALPCAQGSGAAAESSEDCLYLNIWTAATSEGEKRPVMVWIHGGGFDHGATSSEVFDGTRFAQDGVVLVSIAYRLGAFGFLAHPELRQESGRSSGAFGLEDQIAALQWVKSNIHRFGGDPERVTVFGVSAGGIAISLLAGSSAAHGLFQRAISESGGAFGPPTNDPLLSLDHAENAGTTLLKRLGAANIPAARLVPSEKVLRAVSEDNALKFWPVLNGDLLRARNADAYRAGRFHDVPILIGFNSGESTGNAPPNTTARSFSEIGKDVPAECAPKIAAVLALYPYETDSVAVRSYEDLSRDSGTGWNSWTWARLHALHGHSKVFLYYFDVSPPDSTGGAYHGAETQYVFGRPTATARMADAQVSQLMRRYWINFARSADPNGPGLPVWPAFSDKVSDAMVFDRNSSARRLPNVDRMRAIDSFFTCVSARTVDSKK
jgi:para-nitrobenzyl esterase